MNVALTLLCIGATVALVGAEALIARRPSRPRAIVRAASKTIAAAAFVAIGLLAPSTSAFAHAIQIGLVLGAIGDVALLGHAEKAFLGGLVAFLGGHIAYVVAATYVLAIGAWPAAAGPLALVPIVAGGIALAWLWRHLGALRFPVIIYVLAIVLMVVAAVALWRAQALPTPQRTRFLIGAVLFFASDVAVARHKFVAPGLTNQTWGLPAYFAGQLLIAWTLVGL